jgi:acid stress-induced BolA-like protein IbaG/YrbA
MMPPLASPATPNTMNANDVQSLIAAGLPDAQVLVETDDNTHFAARIVAAQFDGKRMIQRHQLIYATLGSKMGNEIHALSIEALTPAEFAALQAKS